ncbi:MAG TPA: VOC family protein [Candidatus Binatia bacterium]|nr:VOC family protein [Candidatus Binatia bacterium]
MRLRQVALVARELDPVVADLCAVLGIEVAFNDPGVGVFGLHNAVMPVGDTFLEVVAPLQPNTTAGRYLDRRSGDGGYMVILQCDDLDGDRARVAALGIRVVWQADLPEIRGTHLHPRDTGGAILSLDWAHPPASWKWAGSEWEQRVRTEVVSEITAVELQSDDPLALAERWSQILNRPVARTGSGVIRIVLDQGAIRFVPARDGRGEGVGGIDVAVSDRAGVIAAARTRGLTTRDDALIIGGTRIYLR